MKMTKKNRIALSQELLANCDYENFMHSNDEPIVYYASLMAGSRLSKIDNVRLMNRNSIPKSWESNPSHPDCKINFALKNAFAKVAEYTKRKYDITPGRVQNLMKIISCKHREFSTDGLIIRMYLRNLNDLRMHCKEMSAPEIYDFSFDMAYNLIDALSLSKDTLSLSLLIMYWIQRENSLIPLALMEEKDKIRAKLDAIFRATGNEGKEKNKFRDFMRELLDKHLELWIKIQCNDKNIKIRSRDRVLQLIKNNPSHTAKTMASCLGVSVKAVQKQIDLLKKENRLVRIGADHGGRWKAVEYKPACM
ncbi:MAG: HTH domain-containing protein [Muribaculaceae bacterium]|nr:HTH domain-containing protein [Muribaculaceae bacterium]